MNKLEKIDLIRKRLNVSYNEANQALEECDGDVVSALIKLENDMDLGSTNNENEESDEDIHVKSSELIEKIKEIIKEGNVKKITVKNEEGESVLEIPVTAGVVGLVLFPYLGILGGMAAMLKEYKLEINKEDNEEDYGE